MLVVMAVLLSGCFAAVLASDGTPAAGQASATIVPMVETRAPAVEANTVATAASPGVLEAVVAASTEALDEALAELGPESATIRLGETITVEGTGATVMGSVATIGAGGVYHISGVLEDGQIVVDSDDETTVELILEGADITCSTSAPIYIIGAETTVIFLAEGSENYVTDVTHVMADPETDEPDAAIFSKADLIFGGSGSLTVSASYGDGIAGKDDLVISGGRLSVTAVDDGIRGKDMITVSGGDITVVAGEDGLQSSNDEDPEKGYVLIQAGTLSLSSGGDGIQAETGVLIAGGSLTIATDGSDAESSKGIKAQVDVTITGGSIAVDSADDAIHSNGSVTIDGGQISIGSGDDAIHADTAVTINGGAIAISRCYEGIESAQITLNDGEIRLVASDDGVNVVGAGGGMGGRPGGFAASTANYLHLNGGYLYVDARGDGLDVNGYIEMTGGLVVVSGPTANDNGAVDYDGGFSLSGGTLIAVGSSGMAQAPDTTSSQNSIMVNLSTAQAAGTPVYVTGPDGAVIVTLVPTKAYQSMVFSAPSLQQGAAYTVYTGGSVTEGMVDGFCAGCTVTGGTQAASVTISGPVTVSGAGAWGGGAPAGRRRP